jgi:hypothetical protein
MKSRPIIKSKPPRGYWKRTKHCMLQNQKQALGTLEGLVKTCKTKIKNTRYKIKNKKDSTESTQNQISPESFWKFEIISDDH